MDTLPLVEGHSKGVNTSEGKKERQIEGAALAAPRGSSRLTPRA